MDESYSGGGHVWMSHIAGGEHGRAEHVARVGAGWCGAAKREINGPQMMSKLPHGVDPEPRRVDAGHERGAAR